jgi:hypothetical protein
MSTASGRDLSVLLSEYTGVLVQRISPRPPVRYGDSKESDVAGLCFSCQPATRGKQSAPTTTTTGAFPQL